MATEIEDLLIRIDATTEGLRSELRKGEQQLTRSTRNMEGSLRKIDKAFSGLGRALGPLGIGVSIGALTTGVQQAIRSLGQLADTADKLGVSTTELQTLRFAAEQVGVETRTLDLAFQRFTRRLGEARQGSGELIGVLRQYNIALNDANGQSRTATSILGDLANAVQGAGDAQEQLRISFKAFDSEGAALVTLLKQGGQAIRDFADEAERMGIVIDEKAVRQAQALNRQFDALIAKAGAAGKAAAVGLAELANIVPPVDIEDTLERLDLLERRAVNVRSRLERELNKPAPENRANLINSLQESIEDINREIRVLLRQLDNLRGVTAFRGTQGDIPPPLPDVPPGALGAELGAAVPRPKPIPPLPENTLGRARPVENPRIILEGLTAAIDDQIESINRLREAYAESTEAGERQSRAERALSEAKAQENTLTEAQVKLLADEILKREEAQAAMERQRNATQELEQAQEELNRDMERLNQDILDSSIDGITALASGYADARDIAVQAIADIIKALIEMIAVQQAAAAGGGKKGGGILGGIFNLFGGLFGGGSNSALTPAAFGGGIVPFASGGRPTPGVPALVGERGPELFVPDTAGTIMPAGSFGGGSSFFIDARGADRQGMARLEQTIKELHGSIEPRAIAAVSQARSRNPRIFR